LLKGAFFVRLEDIKMIDPKKFRRGYCPVCQKAFIGPFDYCNRCGGVLGPEPENPHCLKCGNQFWEHWQFCQHCGASRKEALNEPDDEIIVDNPTDNGVVKSIKKFFGWD
jgi:hypothetical protein